MKLQLATLLLIAEAVTAAPRLKRSGSSPLVKRDWQSPDLESPSHQSCPSNTPLSCSSGGQDSCCLEASNGLILSTQFWDYDPSTGPSDKFTLHGLWADKCSGGYDQYCNSDWEINDVEQILQSAGATDVLDKMQQVWKDINGDDNTLWEHEYNKHGTCMYTLSPDCYGSDAGENQNVVDFFTAAVDMWEDLPTYDWLTQAGFSPSESDTFQVSDFQQALSSNVGGVQVQLECDDNNALNQVMYYFNVQGSVANGVFTPTDATDAGSCQDGFKWLPKN